MASHWNSPSSSNPSNQWNQYQRTVVTGLTLLGGKHLYCVFAKRRGDRLTRFLQHQIALKKGKLNPHHFVALQASDRFTPGEVKTHLQGWGGEWQRVSFANNQNFSVDAENSGPFGFLASIVTPRRYILRLRTQPNKQIGMSEDKAIKDTSCMEADVSRRVSETALLHARGSMASREERPQVLEVPKIAAARDDEVRIFIFYQYIKTIPSRTSAVSDQSSGDLLQVRTLSAALLKRSNKQTLKSMALCSDICTDSPLKAVFLKLCVSESSQCHRFQPFTPFMWIQEAHWGQPTPRTGPRAMSKVTKAMFTACAQL